jgi:subtilisin family serine protease
VGVKLDQVGVPVDEFVPMGPPDLVSLMVHLQPGTDRAEVRGLANRHGGFLKYEYNVVLPDVVNIRNFPVAAIEALKQAPGIARVELDEYHADVLKLHDSTPLIRALQSQITGAGYSVDGSGVRVCVCDTGIDSDHLMYADRIDTAAGYDFYNNDNDPEDDNGHGSHCSGIAVGGTGLSWDPCGTGSMPFQGVAPGATLIGAKILNQFGGGYDSDIIAGINYCADQSPSGGQADIISLSIGTGQYSGPCTHSWAVAANNAVANGVVVVAASGNENYSNALSSPACGVDVIAVGMTWKNDYPTCEDPTTNWNWGVCTDYAPQTDDVGCFSNESDYLDVTAPGANIWSASNAAGGGSITGMSGTSMACPQVAGLAALILDAEGSLTPAEVRQIIRDGAIDMGTAGFDRAYGYGRIDVLNSLALVGPQCSVPADCDDSDPCTIDDCVGGVCSNTPIDCADSDPCTTDYCSGGVCYNDPIDCNDSDPCTTDYCSGGVCYNDPIDCGDSDACTTDYCAGGTCYNDPITCDDSDLCTTDTCDPGSGCVFTPIECDPGEVCVDGVCVPQVCNNNGTCESGEDCGNCPNDCISGGGATECGDGICQPSTGEDCLSCPSDCNGRDVGAPKHHFCCGDGDGPNPVDCTDARCTTEGWACSDAPADPYCCGDGFCTGIEDSTNCALDCGAAPYCGDGSCNGDEDQCSCPGDCGTPPGSEVPNSTCFDGVDNDCDGYTDCADADCNGIDPNCPTCVATGDPCATNDECCSGLCHPVKGTCK